METTCYNTIQRWILKRYSPIVNFCVFCVISVLSLWGYADLCLTIFDFEKVDSKMAARSNSKILENLKGQITDHRNLALTKRSVLNCTMVVWQKYLLANNNHEIWDSNFEHFTGIGLTIGIF